MQRIREEGRLGTKGKTKEKRKVEAEDREEGGRPASLFALCSEQVLIVRPLKYRKCQIQSYSHAREAQYIVLHMYITAVNKKYKR